MVPFDTTRYEPKHPEVVRINPKRQVPVLIHGDLEIFDSTQIFEYLEDLKPAPPLWPRDRAARARARLLELKSDEVYFPHIIRLMGLYETPDDPAAVAARAAAAGYYREMERLLAEREYLAGAYSFADIAFYMAPLWRAHGRGVGRNTELLAWRERMTAGQRSCRLSARWRAIFRARDDRCRDGSLRPCDSGQPRAAAGAIITAALCLES